MSYKGVSPLWLTKDILLAEDMVMLVMLSSVSQYSPHNLQDSCTVKKAKKMKNSVRRGNYLKKKARVGSPTETFD